MIFEGVSAAHTSTNPSTHIAWPGPGAAHATGSGHLEHHFASATQLQLVNATSKIGSPTRRMSSVTLPRLPEVPSHAASPCTGTGTCTSTGPNAVSVPGSGPHSPAQASALAQSRGPWHPHTPLHATVWHRASDTASPFSLRSGAAVDAPHPPFYLGPGPGPATTPCTAPLVLPLVRTRHPHYPSPFHINLRD